MQSFVVSMFNSKKILLSCIFSDSVALLLKGKMRAIVTIDRGKSALYNPQLGATGRIPFFVGLNDTSAEEVAPVH